MNGYKFRLLDSNNVLFEEVTLKVADPEAILLGERVYLPVLSSRGCIARRVRRSAHALLREPTRALTRLP